MMNSMLMLKLLAFLSLAVASCQAAMTDSATGIDFAPKHNGLELFGVGVRKKGPIKVYSVGMYASAAAREALSNLSRTADKVKALSTLRSTMQSKPSASFLLKMNFKVGAEKMAGAIADSVSPRHDNADDVNALKTLIFNGVSAKDGGAATKGTTFQFDCDASGVGVKVDGNKQGDVPSPALSKAFCNVYLDDKCVSSALRESCLANCCKP